MNLLTELRRRWLLVLIGVVVLAALVGPRVATFYTDVLWFRSVGYTERFFSLLYTRFGLGIAAGIVMAVLIGVNLWLARRAAPDFRLPTEAEEVIERYRRAVEPFTRVAIIVLAIAVGIVGGAALVGEWRTYLLWANGGSFGIDDPQFGLDLGFFVFDLPFWTMVNGWLFGAVAVTIVATAAAHYLFGGIRPQSPGQKITGGANIHLSVLLAALVAVRAWGFWLDRFHLSYSERGLVTGLSYTDVNAELRAFTLLTVIAAVCVLLFLANIRFRGWVLPSAGVGILLVASLVLGGAYPAAIQALRVNPQELPRERPFIERNLQMTRYAFGVATDEQALDGDGDVVYEEFGATTNLERDDIIDNSTTLEAIRLWDPATLQNTYNQLQELRPYYDFRDVDVDRYDIAGDPQQVMISARELNINDLTEPSWQNQALIFTHGYGVVSSTVSTAAANGQPEFVSRDIPNEGVEELDLEQPRIYFGEVSPPYSIVGTEEDEFDFETDVEQVFNRYDGADGVNVGGLLNRIAFAIRYAEPNILLSGLIDGDSRILFNRRIRDRVSEIAPFLQLDHDAYPIVVDGRVKWVQDAYTISDMVPYSQRIDLAAATQNIERETVLVQTPEGVQTQEQVVGIPALEGEANYIRNSVKAVVDAYDGTVDLYITDPDDPIIQAWQRAFPNVFVDADEVPDDIRAHFRYPEDLFRVQSRVLLRYHIPNADGFYNNSDLWELPVDSAFADNNADSRLNQRTFPPTYQLIRLPEQEEETFSLIQPFSPAEREVLSAYMAASSDPETYGEIRILEMPPNRTVFGPEQVFARINQDNDVAQLLTLLNQEGSGVVWGNLIVVPVEDSLLYALPLFLRAEQFDIPELRRVVLVYGDDVVMGTSLQEGLETLFGDLPDDVVEAEALPEGEEGEVDATPIPGDEGDGAEGVEVDADVQALIAQAIEAFALADQALSEGDLGTYQEQVEIAEDLLSEIDQALGGTGQVGSAGGGAEGSGTAGTEAPEASGGDQATESPDGG
ncbi:UPF0182 family protein [Euzebya sp.]|uniref:UPF0182 family membrane protein n=1 Tax=Euzebya sp. TaxID=1971409 RepID=UPI00351345F4